MNYTVDRDSFSHSFITLSRLQRNAKFSGKNIQPRESQPHFNIKAEQKQMLSSCMHKMCALRRCFNLRKRLSKNKEIYQTFGTLLPDGSCRTKIFTSDTSSSSLVLTTILCYFNFISKTSKLELKEVVFYELKSTLC